jgi:hypothetical protein
MSPIRIARIVLLVLLLNCLGAAISRAQDFGLLLARCTSVFGKDKFDTVLSVERNRGAWRLTRATLESRDVTQISKLPIMADIGWLELGREQQITSESVNSLAALRRLRRLNLSHASLHDYSLALLKPLKDIEELDVELSKPVTSAAINELKALANVRFVRADGLNAAMLSALKGLPHLECLETRVYRDAGSKVDLSVLRSLKRLGMGFVDGEQRSVPLPNGLRRLDVRTESVAILDLSSAPHIEEVHVYVSPPGNKYGVEDYRHKDRDLKWLTRLPELKKLAVTEADREQVEEIAKLTRLRSLNCFLGCSALSSPNPISFEDALRAFAALRELESLTISAKVTKKEMLVLRQFPNLRCLGGVTFTTATAGRLGELTQLGSMSLRIDASHGAETMLVASLATLPALEDLTLHGTVTDKDLAAIRGLAKLRRLDLGNAAGFTDAGLAALVNSLPDLRTVTLSFGISRQDPFESRR